MIGKDHFKMKIGELGKAFNYSYTAGQQQALYDEARGYSPYHLDRAVIYLINTKPPKLPPSNNEIMIVIREVSNQEWAAKKEKERQEAQEVFYGEKGKKTQHVIKSFRLIMGILSKSVEREDVVAQMRALDNEYPQHGWNIAANKMQTFYERKGLML